MELPPAQIQQGGVDCGLFAIANTYELAAGNDPLDVSFDQGKMHKHLVQSLEKCRFEPFRDSRTPLDSIRDKLVTFIYFTIVQCPSVGTTWYNASCARNGCT